VVYKAMHKLEEHYYAIKRISLTIKKDQDLKKHPFFKEVSTMVKVNH